MALMFCSTPGCNTMLDALADICPGCGLVAPCGEHTRLFPDDRRYMVCLNSGCEQIIMPPNGKMFTAAGYLNDGGICPNCGRENPTTARADDQPTAAERWRWRKQETSPVWASIGLYTLAFIMPATCVWSLPPGKSTTLSDINAALLRPSFFMLINWLCLVGMCYFFLQSVNGLPSVTDKAKKRPLMYFVMWLLATVGISSAWEAAVGFAVLSLGGTLLWSMATGQRNDALFHTSLNVTLYLLWCFFVQAVICCHLCALLVFGKYMPIVELWLRKQRGAFYTGLFKRLARA